MIGIIIYEYFFISNCRVRQFQTVYDRFFGSGGGWIYCTNSLTRFKAHLFILSKGRKLREILTRKVGAGEMTYEGSKPVIDSFCYAGESEEDFELRKLIYSAFK